MATISSGHRSGIIEQAIKVGDFTLELSLREGDHQFLGIGSVYYRGRLLRSNALPWTFYTEAETGFRFGRFELESVQASPVETVVHFRAVGEWLPKLQEADAMGDARVVTRRVAPPVARFRWRFSACDEVIFGNAFSGLKMKIEVDSPGHPISWLIEDTTWEIDGSADGATLVQQDVSTIDLEQAVTKESAFSTIEKFFTDGWGGAYPMDMLPRAAGAAILDFQVKGDLALVLFSERPALTRARIEKFANEEVIHYTDRPFFALTENAAAPERKLLVHQASAPLKRHEWRNLWLDCFFEVRERILKPFGFKVEIPEPRVGAHLWDADLKKLWEKWGDELEDRFPDFARLGYKGVFTHGVWDSITSDPNPLEPGNICCPYQFKFAESFGGDAGMKEMSDKAAAVGMDVFQWFSFHLSKHAPIWKEHPDWVLREANGDPWDGAYRSLWSGRFRSAYGDWMRKLVKESCTENRLSIFWDSYQNLGVTCVDWCGPEKLPQAEEIWQFQAELQKLGIKQECEIITIFGVSAVALYGMEEDKFRRRLWADTVRNDDIFALIDTRPSFFSKKYIYEKDGISPERYFWMCAHRVVPGIGCYPWESIKEDDNVVPSIPGGALAEEYGRVNHFYNAVLPRMHRPRFSEGGAYVLWLDSSDQPSVVWAFREAQVPFCGSATEVGSGRSVECNGALSVVEGEVWQLA